MIAAPVRFKHLLWGLAIVSTVYVAYAAWVVAARVQYPYDHLIWSESPFLTNMLKLHNGVEIYGPAEDANSFVYSPGLEYLCYALLAPIGRHLDLRACRMVNVGIGLLAVAAAGVFMTSELRRMKAGAPVREHRVMAWASPVLMTTGAALILLKNFTFDVCHPDNLHALHLAGGLALAHRAMVNRNFRIALITCAVLGSGILLKQTCAAGGAGIALYLALWGRQHWGWRKSAAILGVAGFTSLLSAWWLLIHEPHGRFWVLDTLLRHTQYIVKLEYLTSVEAAVLHRAPLWLGAALLAMRGLVSRDGELRATTGLWLFAGVFGAAPAISGYVKEFGLYNNLVVVDLWAGMLVIPTLLSFAESGLDDERPLGIAAAATLVLLVAGLYPVKRVPTASHLRYGQELEAALRADVAAGRSVLVAHGTAAWIRAGLRDVPRDRSNSVLELSAAKLDELAHTDERFAAAAYDRIYVGWPTYGNRIDPVLMQNYKTSGTIDGVRLSDPTINLGWSAQMVATIHIYTPKPRQQISGD